MGFSFQSEPAVLQPGLNVNETLSKTFDGCLSVPGRCADVHLGIEDDIVNEVGFLLGNFLWAPAVQNESTMASQN